MILNRRLSIRKSVICDGEATLEPITTRELSQARAGTGARFSAALVSVACPPNSPNFILCRINPESAYQNARNL